MRFYYKLLAIVTAAALLSGCGRREPINGCVLAAANQREVLRAQAFLHPAIPARILGVQFPGRSMGHALLIYRLDAGWWAYDDTFGSRPLGLSNAEFPLAVSAAQAALPGRAIASASWLDPTR